MTDATIYNLAGKKAGTIALPEKLFGAKWNADLVHQVVVAAEANARIPVADTKGRQEVRGGGAKPWRQKGTGRARHGSRRSPIWKGGGVTHGPSSLKVYAKKINRKMRAQALAAVLTRKAKDGQVLFVDTLSFDSPKAAKAREALTSLGGIKGFEEIGTRRKNAALIMLGSFEDATFRSFRNFGNVELEEARNLSPRDILKYRYLVIVSPTESLATLEKRLTRTK